MILIVKMIDNKVFEAEKKRDLVSDIVEFYVEEEDLPEIESFFLLKNGAASEVCKNGRNKLEKIIHEKIEEWKEAAEDSYNEECAMHASYYSNLI